MISIRPGTAADSEVLAEIEIAAGARFREVGMDAIADDEPIEVAVISRAADEGRLWVAADDDEVVGYALGVMAGSQPHLEQVSTRPDRQGLGVGRRLIDYASDWAAQQGARRLTLTTFRDVGWNAPLYEHLGFSVVADGELTDDLAAVRAHERSIGLDDAGCRVVMARPITRPVE